MSLTYITTCTLCTQRFNVPGFEDLLRTGIGQQQVGQIIQKLSEHIQQKHPKEFAESLIPGLQLSGLRRLTHFQTDDATANQMREWMRHQIHELTRTRTVPDEKIREQVHKLALSESLDLKLVAPQTLEALVTLIMEMRDILEERGKFAPKQPGAPATDDNGKPKPSVILTN
jgi:hypothetical protein